MTNYKDKLHHITTFVFDYDGVFTDGIMYLLGDTEVARTANVKDGYAIQLAAKVGFNIAIITGGTQEAVRTRFEGLGVNTVYLGAKNKVEVLKGYMDKVGAKKENVCYMGDDLPDYQAIQMAGLATCPKDAVPEIKKLCDYISPINGGKGCVRDIVEQTLKVHGKWITDKSWEW
jgi:3-deoxy-D-manno-octulosonate 8-phosphate phosphatase (KDO 8-P phosphatase)